MSPHPFANPVVRYAIGATSAITVGVIAYLFLSGTTQLVAYAIAVLDLLVTPQVLKQAVA
jgi:hypothetical protein